MPDVEYSTDVAAPLPVVWDFVKDMDNWAPCLTGYQRHEKIDEDESIWFVKGELGGLTRVAEFRVQVTEWAGPERVTFTMEGLQEPVSGSGSFFAHAVSSGSVGNDAPPALATDGLFATLWQRLSRWLFRRATGSTDVFRVGKAHAPHATRISFRLQLHAGGAIGPVLNLLLTPMLKPVAEDLALKIANAIEAKG